MPSINTKIYYLDTGHFLDTGKLVIVSWVMIADVIMTSCKSGVGVPVSSAGDRTKSARRSWFKASWASFSATCVLSSITASMALVIGWIRWKYGNWWNSPIINALNHGLGVYDLVAIVWFWMISVPITASDVEWCVTPSLPCDTQDPNPNRSEKEWVWKSRITCHNEKTHEKTCYEILFNVVHRWNNLWHFEANTKW